MKKLLPSGAILVPEHAKRVFRGAIFDVYQWQQQLFDGSEATFEMLRRTDTLQVLAIRDGKIVVIDDEQPGLPPHTSLPGGRAEPSDGSWLVGAQRELLEETGMSFKTWRLISVVQPAPKIEWFCPLFLATDFEAQVEQQVDAGEKISVKTMSFEELKSIALSGEEPRLSYLSQIIGRFETLESLLNTPEFSGIEMDR